MNPSKQEVQVSAVSMQFLQGALHDLHLLAVVLTSVSGQAVMHFAAWKMRSGAAA
jgi:UDP-glucose 4-epimerase